MARENWRNYFDFSPLDKNRTNGLCRLCNQNYKDKNGISSNFLKHFKRMHSLQYDQIFNRDDDCLTDARNDVDMNCTTTDLTNTKYKANRIILSITKNLIVRCNLPLNLVENPAFRDFMKECHFKYDPVSSKKLKRDIIPSLSNKVRGTIHEKLNNISYVTLTIDVWSDRRCRSFLGITCHFVDEKMMPQAYLIDFLRFKSPHTGEAIQQLTEEVLERFNIKKKVYKITTDNASSMIKAYKFGLCVSGDADSADDRNKLILEADSMCDDFERKRASELGAE
jgi:BED zinc finger